jgi:hypothetical protein
VTYRRILDWMIGFIDTLFTPLGTTGKYSSTAISTLYSSLLHTLVSQSSLVLSWQHIHNSLIVTAAHYEVFFAQPNSFLALFSVTFDCRLSQFSAATANSGTRLNSNSSRSRSQSYFTTGGSLPICSSWR